MGERGRSPFTPIPPYWSGKCPYFPFSKLRMDATAVEKWPCRKKDGCHGEYEV